MNDIFANTETMQENEHPRFYTAESVMRGHPDKLCDLIADSVLDACLQHDPASRVACEVMATHGHIIVAGEITTSAKPDVFNIVRDTLRDVGYDPKAYQIDCYIHDQSPDIAGAVEPELAEGEDEDTLGAGDQGVMVGYACNETPEYLPMPVVAAQRLVTLLEINNVGFWDSIPLWAVTLIGGLLITVLSFTMILTVYGRMFSLWMYAAIAPIPLSTFAGEPTSSVGKNFIRSYAGVCLQGVVIALSCIIFSAISSSPPAVDTGASVVTAVWTYVGELAFNLLVLVGAIKGCDRIVKEIMGL